MSIISRLYHRRERGKERFDRAKGKEGEGEGKGKSREREREKEKGCVYVYVEEVNRIFILS